MTMSPVATYCVCAVCGAQRITIKDGFKTREDAQKYIDDYYDPLVDILEVKSQKRLYYEFIDNLLDNARRELPSEDMVELINDLGVILDMHFDGIRREVEGEYDKE